MPADPVSSFSFGIEIEGVLSGWFSECSGLSMEREVEEYKEGGVNDGNYKLPGRVKYSNLTLKRGIAESELWDWFQSGLYDGKVKRVNLSILLFDFNRKQMRRWNLRDVFPVKWNGPDFKVDGNQVALETVELAHQGLQVDKWEPMPA